ncbi:MAG TPA: LysR family transcriptional regulator [Polyangiaceae bacterium]|jgi:DNA-binding transcriptional LysR family regulator
MDLNHIAVFVRVVELESFTAAARALSLPKSSVSRTVTRLEDELGVRLLQRTTRQLHLTDAGHAFFESARRSLSELEEASCNVADLGKAPRGVVRVTAPLDIGILSLPDIVSSFVAKYPKVHVELSLSSRVVDLVADGFDLALRAGKLSDSSLVARKIGDAELGLFAAPDYLKRRGRPARIADLREHDCVLFRGRSGRARWTLHGPKGEESVDVSGPLSADDLTLVRRAVERGLGIGLLPTVMPASCAKHSPPEATVRLLPEYAERGGALYVLAPSVRFQPAAVALFRDFLVEQLSAALRPPPKRAARLRSIPGARG